MSQIKFSALAEKLSACIDPKFTQAFILRGKSETFSQAVGNLEALTYLTSLLITVLGPFSGFYLLPGGGAGAGGGTAFPVPKNALNNSIFQALSFLTKYRVHNSDCLPTYQINSD